MDLKQVSKPGLCTRVRNHTRTRMWGRTAGTTERLPTGPCGSGRGVVLGEGNLEALGPSGMRSSKIQQSGEEGRGLVINAESCPGASGQGEGGPRAPGGSDAFQAAHWAQPQQASPSESMMKCLPFKAHHCFLTPGLQWCGENGNF